VAWTAIAWLIGTCALLLRPDLPATSTVCAVLLAGCLVAGLTRRWAVVGLALGFACAWGSGQARLESRLGPDFEDTPLTVQGRVASVPLQSGGGLRFRFAIRAPEGLPALVELTWYEPQWRPLAAEALELEVRLRRPRGLANPGGSDHQARMLREGVGATGYVRRAERRGRGWVDVLQAPVLVARDETALAIRGTLGDRPATGIVTGLAVGLQDALSREQWRDLARSGTSHLMAISGMHIGMFGLVAGWVAGRLQRWRLRRGARLAARDVAVVAGSLAALGYSCLAGWSVPAQRTSLMIGIAALALLARRRMAGPDALALGALAVLVWDPLAPLAVGFWLSFGAVTVILLAAAGHLSRPGTVQTYLRTQWAVTAGLVPVMVASFGSVSLVSIGVNAAAIPLYTLLIVPAVLLSTALVLVLPGAGAVALGAVASLIELSWPLLSEPAGWSWATWSVADLAPIAWISVTLGAVAALSPLPSAGRWAGVLLVAAACAWRPRPPDQGAVHFALLDVGQGLAAVVETRRHVLVYDAGPAFRSGGDAGAIAVEPYLRRRGLRRVDVLVASHDDLDHAGGAASIIRSLPVAQLVGSGRALDAYGPVRPCRRGDSWRWDGVEFEWLHPGHRALGSDNDQSCVLRIRAGRHTLLLTGDIEESAEAEIVASVASTAVDVLLVPHHGSRTSSSAPFVEAARPRWALVAAGHRNRWKFPREDVVRRWQQAGAQVLVTSTAGAIEFDLGTLDGNVAPRSWRMERRRWWHDR